ncbi:DUF6252 family protein [Flavobacterium sp. 245]|uniref:DUF6252 family protein n=1 Tax=Flavobacterium sp. 245 TaxID=2512115 RepID=UPI00105D619F|nr:DUF6252 family protein [Flavobacterium sp. 245]TDP03911.1 hypothetical protein EV145_101305 [Flavobacterium sp. 245]
MKKYFYFLLLLFVAVSCTEDIKFNNPAFQGLKDNVFWRANAYTSYTRDGSFIISGQLGPDAVTFKLPSSAPGTYILGVDDIKTASYSNVFQDDNPKFSTGTKKGSGQIVITDLDSENKTISGTFKFTAINNDATDLENPKITFTEGVFYKIPITPTLEY